MHLDHLPGSFFGPSNLVDLVQHRAAHQAQDRAFIYLVDGETEEVQLTYHELDRKIMKQTENQYWENLAKANPQFIAKVRPLLTGK